MRTFIQLCAIVILSGPLMADAAVVHSYATSTPGFKALKQSIKVDAIRVAQLTHAVNRPTLSLDSQGASVHLLQRFLKNYGSYNGGDPDGTFGKNTQAAVKIFQRKESITPTAGIVGRKTWSRIRDISSKNIIHSTSTSMQAVITDVTLSSTVGENGAAPTPTNAFASTTPVIYAVVALKNALEETAIGYMRSFKGAYVDSRVSHPSRNALRYLHFQWALKDGALRPIGDYAIAFYVNGKKSATVTYKVY